MKKLLSYVFPDRVDTGQIGKFMTFPDEYLIVATREHWLPLSFRIIKQGAVTIFVSALLGGILFFFTHSLLFFTAAVFMVGLIGLHIVVRELVHWCFHLYIVTSRKFLEVRYSPLESEATNSVLLDQIRCTEIDAELHGVIPGMLDIGDVEITFDRPTHQEEFILRGIRSPRKVAALLLRELHNDTQIQEKNNHRGEMWIKNRESNKFHYLGAQNNNYELPRVN